MGDTENVLNWFDLMAVNFPKNHYTAYLKQATFMARILCFNKANERE